MLPSATQFAAEHDFDAVSREGVPSVLCGTFAEDDSALAADTAKIEVFAGVSNLCPLRGLYHSPRDYNPLSKRHKNAPCRLCFRITARRIN